VAEAAAAVEDAAGVVDAAAAEVVADAEAAAAAAGFGPMEAAAPVQDVQWAGGASRHRYRRHLRITIRRRADRR
jgi:hypothetical protein